MDTFWTIHNGRAIYVVLRTFGSERLSAVQQAQEFIESFEAMNVKDAGEVQMLLRGLALQKLAEQSSQSLGERAAPVSSDARIMSGSRYQIKLTSGKTASGLVQRIQGEGFWFEIEPGASIYVLFSEVVEKRAL